MKTRRTGYQITSPPLLGHRFAGREDLPDSAAAPGSQTLPDLLSLVITWITGPSLVRQFERPSLHGPQRWLCHPDRRYRQRWRLGLSVWDLVIKGP